MEELKTIQNNSSQQKQYKLSINRNRHKKQNLQWVFFVRILCICISIFAIGMILILSSFSPSKKIKEPEKETYVIKQNATSNTNIGYDNTQSPLFSHYQNSNELTILSQLHLQYTALHKDLISSNKEYISLAQKLNDENKIFRQTRKYHHVARILCLLENCFVNVMQILVIISKSMHLPVIAGFLIFSFFLYLCLKKNTRNKKARFQLQKQVIKIDIQKIKSEETKCGFFQQILKRSIRNSIQYVRTIQIIPDTDTAKQEHKTMQKRQACSEHRSLQNNCCKMESVENELTN